MSEEKWVDMHALEIAIDTRARLESHEKGCAEKFDAHQREMAEIKRLVGGGHAEIKREIRSLHDRWWSVTVFLIVGLVGLVGTLFAKLLGWAF